MSVQQHEQGANTHEKIIIKLKIFQLLVHDVHIYIFLQKTSNNDTTKFSSSSNLISNYLTLLFIIEIIRVNITTKIP